MDPRDIPSPRSTSTNETAGREHRCEVLAKADRSRLVELATAALDRDDLREALVVTLEPETGAVVLQIREPVCAERFHLGDVMVTRAEVTLGRHRGWAMRAGGDRSATLAAAICDAVAETTEMAWADLRRQVVELVERCADEFAAGDDADWAELAATAVVFEALD